MIFSPEFWFCWAFWGHFWWFKVPICSVNERFLGSVWLIFADGGFCRWWDIWNNNAFGPNMAD